MARINDGGGSPPKKPKPATRSKAAAAATTSWKSVLLNGKPLRGTAHYGQKGGWSIGHTGQDFAIGVGSVVRTPLGGKVHSVGYDKSYGNYVIVKTKDGHYIRYAHLSSIGVRQGETVRDGSYVGKSGNTGRSTGPHLHVEVMTPESGGRFGRGNFVNPVEYLNSKANKIPQYNGTGPWLPGADTQADIDAGLQGGNNIGLPPAGGGGSTTDGGSGGGISGVAGFTKKDYYRWLDAKFGSLKVLREMDKEARAELGGESIDWLVDKLAKEKIVDDSIVASYMAQTGWFKKYGAQASLRLVSERQRPGLFKEEVASYRSGVEQSLNKLGVSLSPQVMEQLARDSYIYGWDAARVVDEAQARFAQTGDVTYDGGEIGEAQDALEEASWALGVSLTQEDLRSMREDIIDGKGYQSQLDALRERSANTYGVFADQIRAGQSLRQVASAYFEKAAALLELGSPDQVDVNDPLFAGGKAFMQADPNTGKMVQKGLWEFEKEVKADSRWLSTKNARDTTFERTGQVLQLMGLM